MTWPDGTTKSNHGHWTKAPSGIGQRKAMWYQWRITYVARCGHCADGEYPHKGYYPAEPTYPHSNPPPPYYLASPALLTTCDRNDGTFDVGEEEYDDQWVFQGDVTPEFKEGTEVDSHCTECPDYWDYPSEGITATYYGPITWGCCYDDPPEWVYYNAGPSESPGQGEGAGQTGQFQCPVYWQATYDRETYVCNWAAELECSNGCANLPYPFGQTVLGGIGNAGWCSGWDSDVGNVPAFECTHTLACNCEQVDPEDPEGGSTCFPNDGESYDLSILNLTKSCSVDHAPYETFNPAYCFPDPYTFPHSSLDGPYDNCGSRNSVEPNAQTPPTPNWRWQWRRQYVADCGECSDGAYPQKGFKPVGPYLLWRTNAQNNWENHFKVEVCHPCEFDGDDQPTDCSDILFEDKLICNLGIDCGDWLLDGDPIHYDNVVAGASALYFGPIEGPGVMPIPGVPPNGVRPEAPFPAYLPPESCHIPYEYEGNIGAEAALPCPVVWLAKFKRRRLVAPRKNSTADIVLCESGGADISTPAAPEPIAPEEKGNWYENREIEQWAIDCPNKCKGYTYETDLPGDR